MDQEFGIKLHEKFNENKLCWKEVKKERGRVRGVYVKNKKEDGVFIRGKTEVKGVWKSHFERLMNDKTVQMYRYRH